MNIKSKRLFKWSLTIVTIVGSLYLVLQTFLIIDCGLGENISVEIDSSMTHNETLSALGKLGAYPGMSTATYTTGNKTISEDIFEYIRGKITINMGVPSSFRDDPSQGAHSVSLRDDLIEYLADNNAIQNCNDNTLDEYQEINRKNYSYLFVTRVCPISPDMRPDEFEDIIFEYMFKTNYRNISFYNKSGDRKMALINADTSFQTVNNGNAMKPNYGISYFASNLDSRNTGFPNTEWTIKGLFYTALHPGISANISCNFLNM